MNISKSLIVGDRIGRLTLLAHTHDKVGGQKVSLFACECGAIHKGYVRAVTQLPSCGCARGGVITARLLKHGHAHRGNRAYNIWCHMIARCERKASKDYINYGGRGIKVCLEWRQNFTAFLADMGEPPAGKSLGRINNDGNYEPKNCRWETNEEQQSNKRSNRILRAFGKEMPLARWAREIGIEKRTLHHRVVVAGWPIEKALSTPLHAAACIRLAQDLERKETSARSVK